MLRSSGGLVHRSPLAWCECSRPVLHRSDITCVFAYVFVYLCRSEQVAMARKEQEGMAAGDMDTNIEEGEHDHQFVQVLFCVTEFLLFTQTF